MATVQGEKLDDTECVIIVKIENERKTEKMNQIFVLIFK